jgi:hypothetical protein
MAPPTIVTIEHHSTKEEVKRKLRERFGEIRAQVAPYVSAFEEEWSADGVSVRVVALAQPITSRIDVDDRLVRIEVGLPGLLGVFSRLIADRVQKQGAQLLLGKD